MLVIVGEPPGCRERPGAEQTANSKQQKASLTGL
jgi:hypothetical protein